ncbi:MAG: glycosyltransferase [Candidatus Komeilibacteria bacterium]
MPRFSIIIPTFNEATVIGRSLKQWQSYRSDDLEVIMADGGSTDGTIQIARPLADQIARKPDNRPETIARGRNRGAAMAKGQILVFLDADVLVADIEAFLAAIIEGFSQPRIVAATARSGVYPQERLWSDKLFHWLFWQYVKWLNRIGRGAAKGECQIIRKSIFNQLGGYNERLGAGEDFELYNRLARQGRIACLETPVYESPRRYRQVGYWHLMWQWSVNYLRAAQGKPVKKWSTVR